MWQFVCLALLNWNSDVLLRRFIAVDETLIHHNRLETKKQSKPWIFRVNLLRGRPKRITPPTMPWQQSFRIHEKQYSSNSYKSQGSVVSILNDHEWMNMRILSARWVTHSITIHQKANRVTNCGFASVQLQSWGISAPFHNYKGNMNTPQQTGGPKIVEIVEFSG